MTDESFAKGSDTNGRDSEENDLEGVSRANQLQFIADFWSALGVSGETGATDWATLEKLERQVTDAMYGKTPNIKLAESLTSEAFLRIAGNI
jgi:AAA+ ATPase superfamily predicted ATPase